MTDINRLLVTTVLCMTCPALAAQAVLYIAAIVYDRRARMWRVIEGRERQADDDEASARALRWWRQ